MSCAFYIIAIHAFSPVDHFTKDMEYLDGLMPPTAVIV